MQPANSPPVAPGASRTEPGVKSGGQGWDHREAFWEQWSRVLHIRSYPANGSQDLTGAVEGLGLLALMAADKTFRDEWDKRPLHQGPNSTLFATLQDNQTALEIIARFVERKGWAEKKRVISNVREWRRSGNGTTPSAPESSGPLTASSTSGAMG